MNASFEATLEVKGIDSIGVLNTITKTISEDFNVNIMRLLIEAKDGVFEGKIKMKVHDVEDIQKMCVTLSKIQNIKSVGRVADYFATLLFYKSFISRQSNKLYKLYNKRSIGFPPA